MVRDGEGELFELDGQIDADGLDVFGQRQGHGSEIEDPFDPRGNEGVGDFLGRGAGDGDDRQADAPLVGDPLDVVEIEDSNAFHRFADFCGVGIEGGDACCNRGDGLCVTANTPPPVIAMTTMTMRELLKRMDMAPVSVVSAVAGRGQ